MTLKLIPAGEFTMGSRDDDAEAEKDEKPAHRVKISDFYMGTHEVTQAQYEAVISIYPSYFSSTGGGKNKVAGRPTDQYPVEYVTWLDAVRFCNVLSQRDGLPPFYEINGETAENVEVPNKRGPGYHLPTEAEWEYACRAGKDMKYSFGDETALLSDYGWFDQNSVRMTHNVGEKQPSAFGLFDMHGNVGEWCTDLYDENHYKQLATKQSATDNPLWLQGTGQRVMRGGSWSNAPSWSRSANRDSGAPTYRWPGLGFRLVLNLSDHINALANKAQRTVAPSKPSLSNASPKEAVKPNIDLMSRKSTRMAFALIKPGVNSMMGSPDRRLSGAYEVVGEAAAQSANQPCSISASTEVTRRGAQYKAVTGSNPSFFSSAGGGQEMVSGQSTDNYPVENVSWLEAARFCNNLSIKEKLPPYYQFKDRNRRDVPDVKGTGYRLPTEAEWEYASRAGAHTRFYFGDDPRQLVRLTRGVGGSSGGIVHPVGQKTPNGLGLFDMLGNVAELCGDWANLEYYKGSPTADPLGSPKGNDRVHRGGGWQGEPTGCRSASRGYIGPGNRNETVGFRIARGLTASELKTAFPGLATVTHSDDLIKNPGCEELGADGRIDAWHAKQGIWTRGSKEQSPFRRRAFTSTPGSVPEAELSQDVDVSQFAGSIDKKTQSFAFSAHVRSWNQAPTDTCRIVVEFLDEGRSVSLEKVDSGEVASVDRWEPVEWVKVAPAKTRWIRVRLISRRQSGDANDGIYDGLSLKAVKAAAVETELRTRRARLRQSRRFRPPRHSKTLRRMSCSNLAGLYARARISSCRPRPRPWTGLTEVVPIIRQMVQLSDKYRPDHS